MSSNNGTPKVEIHDAFVYDCPNCGRENFIRSFSEDLTPDEVNELVDKYGEDPEYWSSGCWASRPTEVTCEFCSSSYETYSWDQGDDRIGVEEDFE